MIATVQFNRVWAMPSADTFSVPPIAEFVKRYLRDSRKSIDPFARNSRLATFTNDLNPKTASKYHMEAEEFLELMSEKGISFDLAILDPPYSPGQISECYSEAGIACSLKHTQNAALYSRVKSALLRVLDDDAVVLSFGWNSVGMGRKHHFEAVEIQLVCHGGAHNDTICLAERRIPNHQSQLFAMV